ncbi:MAG: SDR family NAD(P)-dependent oxidoreductase [Bacilli bacterium]|nr:SDR family NAD(P)-dependent oxidoreductase [Bacilli bacterium]
MLEGKVAIITGGTRGIGFETALTFLENKARVCILGSKEETVSKALEELKKLNEGYEVIGYYPNLTKENEVKDVFEQVKKEFGKIDIVVNNAGVSSKTKILDYEEAEVDKIIDLNIKAVFITSKVASEYLKETKGVILNTSSMVSIYGQPSGILYPASKEAVNGLTKSLARELAPLGVRVNAVAPGITKTDMVEKLPQEMIEPLIKTIPLGRIGTPRDIANAFLFLASDLAEYITGVILSVDGCARS